MPGRPSKAVAAARQSSRSGASLPRVPRDENDDYTVAAVERRRAAWERASGARPTHVAGQPVDLDEARGKIENLVGFAQVPLGIAGPLRVDTSAGVREVYVPMATTEGALVASYSRGMRLLGTGRARARVVHHGLTQNPILVYADAERAIHAAKVADESLDRFRDIVANTTKHGRLIGVKPRPIGRRLIVSFSFHTGDAIGINMAARAADLCSADLATRTGASARYVHGQDVEKRANAHALAFGRGRSVVCDVELSRADLAEHMRVTPEDLVAVARSYALGYADMGTHNWLVQSANGLAAVMIACGQDVAYVTESATGFLDFDVTESGGLYASAYLPALLVGTVGGGSGQGTAAECLALLDCRGAGKATRFAEILAATVLAGDLSLMSAFCAHEFVAAHERLGRNRPSPKPAPLARKRKR